jgi:hypothetical protein
LNPISKEKSFQKHPEARVVFKSISLSLFLFSGFILLQGNAAAQSDSINSFLNDSVTVKQHSPVKAAVMSILLPGLGQVYNKKYWKVPIVYAGLGVMTYFIVSNAREYKTYKGAYIEKNNNDSTGEYSDLTSKYTEEDLLNARDYYRRNLEISCMLTGVWYILNIVDAAVDAHLFTYDISKDLSLKVEPVIMGHFYSRNFASGLRLSFRF